MSQQVVGDKTEFSINSYVLVQYRDRPPTKFHTNWEGPFRVVSFAKNTYVLQNLVNMKLREVHVTQIKPFLYDEHEVDPVDIARKEAQEFLVERILQHRGGPRKSTLEFLVKWTGDGEDYDKWVPWELVRDNHELHKYCFTHKMKALLTKEQKAEVQAELDNNI